MQEMVLGKRERESSLHIFTTNFKNISDTRKVLVLLPPNSCKKGTLYRTFGANANDEACQLS